MDTRTGIHTHTSTAHHECSIMSLTSRVPLLEIPILVLEPLDLLPVPIPSPLPVKFPKLALLLANPGIDENRVVITWMGGGVAVLAVHRRIHVCMQTVRED